MRPIPVTTRLIAVFAAASLAGFSAAGQATAAPHTSPAKAPGGLLWTSMYPLIGTAESRATSLAVSPGGGAIFAAGSLETPSTAAYATVAYDAATGTQMWASQYHGPVNDSSATAVTVSPDGGTVFVTGDSKSKGTGFDFATVAYNAATGQQLWVSRYNGPGDAADVAAGIAAGPGGQTIFVTGTSQGTTSGADYATIAYDAVTGRQLRVSRYNGRANGFDQASGLAISRDGHRLYVTGASRGRTSKIDYATVAYGAATGRQLWAARYNGHANMSEIARSVAVSADGRRVFVTGSSQGQGSSLYDYATVAYQAATGHPLWTRRYNGPHGQDMAVSVVANPRRNAVYVTGTSISARTHRDIATVAYNATTGAPLWVSRFDGDRKDDIATALAVSPDGGAVFVAGSSGAGNTSMRTPRFVVVAFGSVTGTKLWSTRLLEDGGITDAAASVAVSPNNRTVFATGKKKHLAVPAVMTTVAISR